MHLLLPFGGNQSGVTLCIHKTTDFSPARLACYACAVQLTAAHATEYILNHTSLLQSELSYIHHQVMRQHTAVAYLMAGRGEPGDSQEHVGPLDRFLQRRRFGSHARWSARAAFRSTNICQQLLAQEVGWPGKTSLSTWRQVQVRSMLVQLQLPPVWHSPPNTQQRQEVCSLQVQPPPGDGVPGCRRGDTTLAAIGYSSGIVHLVRVADMLNTVDTAALEAAGSQDHDSSRDATARAAATLSASIPPGTVCSVDLQDRLLSCCWGHSDVPELATAGALGVKIRRFVEGRHHEYPLQLRGGAQLAKAGQVKYLEQTAAYTLVATKPGGLVLWDCRAASRAVAELPTSNMAELLQPLPGGTVLLTAAADGLMALYDVRRVSSNSSSIVNFGKSRSSQQLITSFNVPARADEAMVASGGSSSSNGKQHIFPFFSDVRVNPADCNQVAYVRPDFQVGVVDLFGNRVLQQVCTTESSAGTAEASTHLTQQRQAAARCCWDSTGRVLYSHGLLRHADSTATTLQPTLAAVDFGSWLGRQIHSHTSFKHHAAADSRSTGTETFLQTAGSLTAQQSEAMPADATAHSFAELNFSSYGGSAWRGGGLMCRQGQVLHLPVPYHAVPTELAVGGDNGELWMGTLQGDVTVVQ